MHDIDEIRRKAMGVLEKEAGGPVAAAKQAGMSHSQWAIHCHGFLHAPPSFESAISCVERLERFSWFFR